MRRPSADLEEKHDPRRGHWNARETSQGSAFNQDMTANNGVIRLTSPQSAKDIIIYKRGERIG